MQAEEARRYSRRPGFSSCDSREDRKIVVGKWLACECRASEVSVRRIDWLDFCVKCPAPDHGIDEVAGLNVLQALQQVPLHAVPGSANFHEWWIFEHAVPRLPFSRAVAWQGLRGFGT